MFKRIGYVLLTLMASAGVVNAQDENDAIRYGMNHVQGTARGTGVGGALGSIGGDFGSLSINPAGIGIYRKSEFALSTSYTSAKSEGTYLGEQTNANANKLTLSHLGYVKTKSKTGEAYKRSSWKSTSFAIGFNRLASFTNEYTYSGKNNQSSIAERWAEDFNRLGGINATTRNQVNYSAFGAYETFIVDRDFTVGGDTNKARAYVPFTDGIRQTKTIIESGGMNEFTLSLGGNYMEKLMLGATLGLPTVNYTRYKAFNEDDISGNTNNDFKYLKYYENLTTSGMGVNMKLGAIYKANKNFRAGLALHTPTTLFLSDESSVGIETHTDSFLIRNNLSTSSISSYRQDSTLYFEYRQTTPYKMIVSASYLFDKYGFITADLEYVDYSTMKYNFRKGYENETRSINAILANTYTNTVNIRLGAEAKLKDFSFRAGYAHYGSPSKQIDARTILSGGLGYRTNTWFIDAAYMRAMQESRDTPYVLARSNAAVQNASLVQSQGNFLMTLGFKF